MLLNCDVGEDSWESLDCKEIQPVHPKESWVFIGRTDAEAETPIFWPPDLKSWLIGKGRDAGKDWGQEEKGTTEDEVAGWHHWLDGRGSEWTPGVGDGQGGLACCDSWDRKESDTTEWLNWTELITSWEMLDWMKHELGSRHRWHHPYGRKQRRTKEPLDESEIGEWKSWLKTQHSEN